MFQDLHYAMRSLRRTPGFSATVVLTLALGIGANTAIFSVVNAIVIRPLRFPNSDRLMVILSTARDAKGGFMTAQGVYLDWRDNSTSFEVVAGVRASGKTWSGAGQPQPVSVVAASHDFFSLIGVQPVLGRVFTNDEDQIGRGYVALLDGGFWQRHFGGSKDVLGHTIVLDGMTYSIIGILPPDIRFAHFGKTDIWIPIAANRAFRGGGDVVVVGRLRPGVTREAAQAEMQIATRRIGHTHIEDSPHGVFVEPLHDWVVGDTRQVLLTMFGAVVFLLLICCANIANLLVNRSTAKVKEMAIRASLGAGRFQLVRQILVENAFLTAIGGVFGLGLAVLAVRAIPAIDAVRIPRADEIGVDKTVLFVAAVISMASGILFGMASVFQIGRRDFGAMLRSSTPGSPGGQRLRNGLVVVQVALALILLSGAGLMTNSLLRLFNIDLGFERANLLTVSTLLPYRRYNDTQRIEFQRRLAGEVSRMPGVELVSVTDFLPLQAVLFPYELRTENVGATKKCEALGRHIAPNYLRVMGIPLLMGRDFEPGDDTRRPIPTLINRNIARALFGAEEPVGRHLGTQFDDRELEVVGMVGDAHQIGLTKEPGLQLYLPLAYGSSAQYVVARTAPTTGDLSSAIRAAVLAIDPEVRAPEISDMNTWYLREVAKPRFYLMLFGAFAAVGIILAAVGIYGVVSYGVVLRTHEFGVRIALGAHRRDIIRLVLGAGLCLVGGGAILGLIGSLAATQLLSAMLYGVRPNDPLTFGCVLAFVVGIGLLACYIAARRAAAVDPIVALRCE